MLGAEQTTANVAAIFKNTHFPPVGFFYNLSVKLFFPAEEPIACYDLCTQKKRSTHAFLRGFSSYERFKLAKFLCETV